MTVEEHLCNLIRIPSASSLSNRPVIDYAMDVLSQSGWSCLLDAYRDERGVEKLNLIAAPPGQDPAEPEVDLGLLCHSDTVPPAADWEQALTPLEREGTLYGCGACDVKGFLACLLTAACEVSGQGIRAGLRIALTADEEIGCLGSQRLLDGGLFRPRTLVIGEPTSLHAARAGKGYCLGEMTVRGAEAHSAHPKRGRSAIVAAAKIVLAIEQFAEELEREVNPLFDPPYTSINIGTIRGGTAKNVVPGECRFLVEWRPVPGASLLEVPERVEAVLQAQRLVDPLLEAKFMVLRESPGFETRENSDLVASMMRLTGKQAISIPFGSEASVFASVAEEIVVFGPGDMQTAHSPRECVPVAELHEAVRCVTAIMRRV